MPTTIGSLFVFVAILTPGFMSDSYRRYGSRDDPTPALHEIKTRFASRSRWMFGIDFALTTI